MIMTTFTVNRQVLGRSICLLLSACHLINAELLKPALNSTGVYCPCEIVGNLKTRCLDNSSQNCETVESMGSNEMCQKYASCKSCARGLDRCLTCPPKMHGQWCEKDCLCKNDGACSPNGTCICQNGFTGLYCEIVSDKISVEYLNAPQNGKMRTVRQATSTQCPVIPSPDNGNIHNEFDSPKAGDAAKYTCKENYTMMGSRTRHCLPTGKWTGEAPTCEKMCSFPSTTEHINVKVNPHRLGDPLYDTFNNEVLAELEFSCDPGYNLVGPLRIRCASGLWDQEAPNCRQQITCLDPGLPKNGNRTSKVQSTKDYRIGSQLVFYCNSQYTLVGSQSLICMPSGYWNAPVPICIPNVISKCTFNCKLPWDVGQSVFKLLNQTLKCTSVGNSEIQEDKNYIIVTQEN